MHSSREKSYPKQKNYLGVISSFSQGNPESRLSFRKVTQVLFFRRISLNYNYNDNTFRQP